MKDSRQVRSLWQSLAPKQLRRYVYHATRSAASSRVSVVVPVYNVELYLDECVHSLVEQTYKNMEIILVDDGSTDTSGDISESWSKRDNRITVVHQQNSGLSAARNTGLRVANGDYVIFIDSDDTVPREAFTKLVNQLEHSGSDIATGNVKRFKGKSYWPGWNQSYSHRPELYPERDGASNVSGVSLSDHPELLFDTTAWNKMFRRQFLLNNDIQFPVGKLYEDMHPIATAYSLSNGIDVIFDNVYNYRVRENNSSITQKRSELKNLKHKMEMVDKIYADVSERPGSESLLRTLEFKVFEGDLPVYSPYLGRDENFDEIYFSSVERYWKLTNSEVVNKTTLAKRAQIYWESKRDAYTASIASAWVRENFFSIPIIWDGSTPRADLSHAPETVRVLSEHKLDDMSRYVVSRTAITETTLEKGRLKLEGYAFLDGVPNDVTVQRRFYLESESGERTWIEHSDVESEWANNGWWNLSTDRSDSGFAIDCDLSDALRPAFMAAEGPDRSWHLAVQFSIGERQWTAAVDNVWRGGEIRLGGTADLTTQHSVYVDWSDWTAPLSLKVRKSNFKILSAEFNHNTVRIAVGRDPSNSSDQKVVMKRSHDSFEVYGRLVSNTQQSATFEFDISHVPDRENAYGHTNSWKVLVSDRPNYWIPIAPIATVAVKDEADIGWDVRTAADGYATLIDPANALLIETISFADGYWCLRGSVPVGLEDDAYITMWSNNGTSHSVELQRVDDAFSIVIDPTVVGSWSSKDAWKTGEYYFWLRCGSGDSRYRIRASRKVVLESLPANVWTSLFHSRFHVAADNFNVSMRVGTPTKHSERGRFNLERMRADWGSLPDSDVVKRASVVFSSYMSRSASDSGLAICEYMREHHPGFELYWAVEDGSVSVPTGSKKLIRRSEEWFEVLTSTAFLVNNVGAIDGYTGRSHQKFIQTWHGTPFKLVGKSEVDHDGFEHPVAHSRIENESKQWDLFIAQNEFLERVARRDFDYQGEIIRSGYPRNDRLVVSAEEERLSIRRQLGVDDNSYLILYAPTWRESLAAGTVSRMVEFLDFDNLLESLDPETCILLRGHNYNAAHTNKRLSKGRLIDVTHSPDINDLILASDLLITDYSSVMFDYLVTGKPIVYFVPDIDEYIESRGSYGALNEFASGPIVKTVEGLIELLKDPADWLPSYSRLYSNMRSKFVPWDDGFSTHAVVERMLALASTANEEEGPE